MSDHHLEQRNQVLNPQLPLIAENEGPFIPAIYLSYKRTNIEALRVTICPTSGNLVNETKFGVTTFGPNYLLAGDLLLPYAGLHLDATITSKSSVWLTNLQPSPCRQLDIQTDDDSGCVGAMLFFPSNISESIVQNKGGKLRSLQFLSAYRTLRHVQHT